MSSGTSSGSVLSFLSDNDSEEPDKSSSRTKVPPKRRMLFDFDLSEEDESSITESSAVADVSHLSSQQPIVDLTTDVTTSQSLPKSPLSSSTSSAYSPTESPESDESPRSSPDQVFQ